MTTTTVNWTEQLAEQLDWHWTHLRGRVDGLTDEEYRWEPVPGSWNVRPRAEATTAMAAGDGPLVIDFVHPEPDPVPVPTIAWRLGHLIVDIFGARSHSHFGGPPFTHQAMVWPATAAGALALLDETYASWSAGVRTLDPVRLAEPVGMAEGEFFADHPYAELVLHINREVIHHGAEIALLRDLYRWLA